MQIYKSGRVWVGDLSYVLYKEWDEVCELVIDSDNIKHDGLYCLSDGREFCIYDTGCTEGKFYDQYGNEYCIDSGFIGIIHIDSIMKVSYNNPDLGNVFEFDIDIQCYREDKQIIFGNICIELIDTNTYEEPDTWY